MYYICLTTVYWGEPYLPNPVVAEWDSGGQHVTWQKHMNSLTKGLSLVGSIRLAAWGFRNLSHLWSEILSDRASSRSQWRSFTFSLGRFCKRHLDYIFTLGFLSLISDMSLFTSSSVSRRGDSNHCFHTRFMIVKLHRTIPLAKLG